jgi:Flp pilus assembly protein TadB
LALSSPALVVGAPTGLALWRHWVSRVRHRRRDQQLAGEVPPFVDELIQQLKAGRSLAQGLRAACGGYEGSDAGGSALDDALAPLRSGMAAGIGLEAALGRVRSGVPADVELVVNTLSVLVHRGGAALPSLERLSDTLRSAQWVNLEVRAQASQATASAAVLAALPALFVVGLVALDRRMAEFYLTDQAGMACLLAAATLSYVGWWWMDRIIWGRG